MKSILNKTLLALALAGTLGANASAQTTLIGTGVQDGDFSSAAIPGGANQIDFNGTGPATSQTNSPTNVVPYWAFTGVDPSGSGAPSNTTNDEGVNDTGGPAGNPYFAYFAPDASSVFNLETSAPMVAGATYTLTWYALASGNASANQTVNLFSQAAPGSSSYTYNPISILASANGTTDPVYALTADYLEYTLVYTATASDAGNDIGVTFGNDVIGANYMSVGDVSLTEIAPVPEPATLGMTALGCISLLFWGRNRSRRIG